MPYSPDLNPIEMALSKLKAYLCRIGTRTFDQLIEAIGDICDLFTPDECWNFFEAAGYASGIVKNAVACRSDSSNAVFSVRMERAYPTQRHNPYLTTVSAILQPSQTRTL